MKYSTEQIRRITLVSSESCNLNCSYCEIAKSISNKLNPKHTQIIRESFENGSYFNNIQQIVKRLKINPSNINSFDLWGQEPTLTLDSLCKMLPPFFNLFPNLNGSMFSTNMVQYPERIVLFCNTIEQLYTNPKRKFRVGIQLSFDGMENTKNFRGIEPQIILKNIEKLILELNKQQYQHIYVDMWFNTVMTKEEMVALNTKDKVKKYWEELDNITTSLINLITNKNVFLRRCVGAGLESPVNATKEQGLALSNFIKLSKEIYEESNYDLKYNGYQQIINKISRGYNVIYNMCNSEYELIDILADYDYYPDFIRNITRRIYCGPGVTGLKIRYDGSVVHCHNVIHHMTEDSLKNSFGWKNENLKTFAKHNYYPNLITCSDEELEHYFYIMNVTQSTSYPYTYSLIVTLMNYLRDANQIDKAYFNDELLLKHALVLTFIGTCLDASINYLGTGMGTWAGLIRFYCNGALFYVDSSIKKSQKNNQNAQKRGKIFE